MNLVSAVQHGLRPSQTIRWDTDADGNYCDLTYATEITGIIKAITYPYGVRAIEGALTVTYAEQGDFRWDYSTYDVAYDGVFKVQFTATFNTDPTPAKTVPRIWTIYGSLDA